MVFNNNAFMLFGFLVLIIWLGAVNYFLFRMIRHYNTLTKDISDHGLKAILEQILKRQQGLTDKTVLLQRTLDEVITDGRSHIQKIGLIRFNPFSDTGGSQSFTLAILDQKNNGIVMTSLYARTGNRWYAKEIKNSKGLNIELSKEEESAIKRAQEIQEVA